MPERFRDNGKTKYFMRYLLIATLLCLTLMAEAQKRNENLAMLWSINSFRQSEKMPVLTYRFVSQPSCDKRLEEIQKNFSIPEEGYEGICDGELIFRNDNYLDLLKQMTNLSEIYFDPEFNFICMSITKSDRYYAIVRIWKR